MSDTDLRRSLTAWSAVAVPVVSAVQRVSAMSACRTAYAGVVTVNTNIHNTISCSWIHTHSSGFRVGAAAHPLASFRKIQGLRISKIVRTADSTIIIITNFFLAASSHEIFLRVGGREGMKGLGALQRHQLPHPPCKNPGSATAHTHTHSLENSASQSK